MEYGADMQKRHEDLLTGILVKAVNLFKQADVKTGEFGRKHSNYDPERQSMEITGLAEGLQRDEVECENGTINPYISCSVIPAFSRALKAKGADIHPGPNTPREGYEWKPNTISVGGTVSLSSVFRLSLSGRDLKNKLAALDEDTLRRAAREALQEDMSRIKQSYKGWAYSVPYPTCN